MISALGGDGLDILNAIGVQCTQMKSVSPTEARKQWFRLLDEVAAGETVEIQRGGKRIVLRCEPEITRESSPEYGGLIRAVDSEQADKWGWEWSESSLAPLTLEGDEDHP
jgi:hypothetical protein